MSVKVTPKKSPVDIQSQSFSATGAAQNADFMSEVARAGDAPNAAVQTVRVRRTKGKQDDVIILTVEEIPSLIGILQHTQDKLIPATVAYGRAVEQDEEK